MTQSDIIESIAKMDNEQQTRFYNIIRTEGFEENEIRAIQGMVFFSKLYSDPELYREVRDTMGHILYKRFTN